MNYILIALGGAIGSVLRYIFSIYFTHSTLIVNVIGSFLIGLISFYFVDKLKIDNEYIKFLKVGICGGLTTFSTFGLETFKIGHKNIFFSIGYVIITLTLCILAIYLSKVFVEFLK